MMKVRKGNKSDYVRLLPHKGSQWLLSVSFGTYFQHWTVITAALPKAVL